MSNVYKSLVYPRLPKLNGSFYALKTFDVSSIKSIKELHERMKAIYSDYVLASFELFINKIKHESYLESVFENTTIGKTKTGEVTSKVSDKHNDEFNDYDKFRKCELVYLT